MQVGKCPRHHSVVSCSGFSYHNHKQMPPPIIPFPPPSAARLLNGIYFQDITLHGVYSHHRRQLNLPLPGIHWHNQPGACPEPAKLGGIMLASHEEIYSFPAQLTLVWAQLGLSPPLTHPHHIHAHELSVELVPISFGEGSSSTFFQC